MNGTTSDAEKNTATEKTQEQGMEDVKAETEQDTTKDQKPQDNNITSSDMTDTDNKDKV